ncbi:ParB-like nuclease domain protein [Microbacterium phage ValentiniPuff]|uniref:ParB-like nuclease domain protein n=1 Tax=Microbacterium phage ValentiniPuff TaxID=2315705 RepID=A0A386KPE7_9CAUD|nr:ParB-like nuclease domain protein [Microbacterium phage ValentiniPuff]
MAGSTQVNDRMDIGDGIAVVRVQASHLREQDINAQQMDPTMFARLVENIRQRGALESLPYCHQPNGVGPISIISGHHRAKAARAAGLTEFPVLLDTTDMPRSLIRAKQIAHNQLSGSPDEEILRRMIDEIDSAEDLLMTGLDVDLLPTIDGESPTLNLPHLEFDWREVSLMFLPEQLDRLAELVGRLGSNPSLVGVAALEQFAPFSQAVVDYSKQVNVKNLAMAIDMLTRIALEQLDAEDGKK